MIPTETSVTHTHTPSLQVMWAITHQKYERSYLQTDSCKSNNELFDFQSLDKCSIRGQLTETEQSRSNLITAFFYGLEKSVTFVTHPSIF